MLTMRQVALSLGLLLGTSQGRRMQSEHKPSNRASQAEALHARDVLAQLLSEQELPAAFKPTVAGLGQSALRATSADAQNRVGRHMKMQEGDLEGDDDWGPFTIVNDPNEGAEYREYQYNPMQGDPVKAAIQNLAKMTKDKNYIGKRKVKAGVFVEAPDIDKDIAEAIQELGEEDKQEWEEEEITTGKIVRFGDKGVFLDIGGAEGFLSDADIVSPDVPAGEVFDLGDVLEVVLTGEEENGKEKVLLADPSIVGWSMIAEAEENDKVIMATVIDTDEEDRIEVMLPGGVPAVLLDFDVNGDMLVGQTLPVKIVEEEMTAEQPILIVSHTRAKADSAMETIKVGMVVEGIVRRLQPYGLFVDIAGLSGLLHISQISLENVEDPSAIFPIGSTIKAMVINADKARGRVALSTKTLEEQPGDMLKDPEKVYANAEQAALKYQEKLEAERKAREEAAQDVLFGLEALTQGLGLDPKELNLQNLGVGGSANPEAPKEQ
mmetsp:Transcript_158318/g.275045  ORF Transcript_158318/g.275045 Transcript_158318/m.275045 type:complete len:493 (+) Transcript_158318:77-1555(+)